MSVDVVCTGPRSATETGAVPGTIGSGTIVMATKDRGARAVETVERLLTLPDRWPIVVVDDAGTDGAAAMLADRFAGRITVLRSTRSLGAAARTAGVRAARTPIVAFADDDSWWAPGALTVAAAAFAADDRLGLLAARVLLEPGGRADPIVHAFARGPATDLGPAVLGFLACGAVARRSAYLEVGGFEQLLGGGGEEELLAMDLRAAGWRLVHVPDVVAHHEPHTTDAGNERRRATMIRNQLLIAGMRRSFRYATVAAAFCAMVARRDPAVRSGLRAALVRAPAVVRRRRRLPRMVEAELRALAGSRPARNPV